MTLAGARILFIPITLSQRKNRLSAASRRFCAHTVIDFVIPIGVDLDLQYIIQGVSIIIDGSLECAFPSPFHVGRKREFVYVASLSRRGCDCAIRESYAAVHIV